jgi:hypothetical protein
MVGLQHIQHLVAQQTSHSNSSDERLAQLVEANVIAVRISGPTRQEFRQR